MYIVDKTRILAPGFQLAVDACHTDGARDWSFIGYAFDEGFRILAPNRA
jgi:hypothetical protein